MTCPTHENQAPRQEGGTGPGCRKPMKTPTNTRAVKTPCGTLTANVKMSSQFHIVELLRGSQEERVLAVVASRDQGIMVSTPNDQVKIELKEDHKGICNNFRGQTVAAQTPLGVISVELVSWGDDHIPPGGVVGWVYLHCRPYPLQLVTLCMDAEGKSLVARIAPSEAHPAPTKTIPVCGRKGSGTTWTVNT